MSLFDNTFVKVILIVVFTIVAVFLFINAYYYWQIRDQAVVKTIAFLNPWWMFWICLVLGIVATLGVGVMVLGIIIPNETRRYITSRAGKNFGRITTAVGDVYKSGRDKVTSISNSVSSALRKRMNITLDDGRVVDVIRIRDNIYQNVDDPSELFECTNGDCIENTEGIYTQMVTN